MDSTNVSSLVRWISFPFQDLLYLYTYTYLCLSLSVCTCTTTNTCTASFLAFDNSPSIVLALKYGSWRAEVADRPLPPPIDR